MAKHPAVLQSEIHGNVQMYSIFKYVQYSGHNNIVSITFSVVKVTGTAISKL